MLEARDLLPRAQLHRWSACDDDAEHDGVALMICWLGLVAEICVGRRTRSFSDWPADEAPTSHPNSDTPAVAPAGVSVTRPVGHLRSGQSQHQDHGA